MTGIKTEMHLVEKCAEYDCVWNYVHWKNGENYANGCYKISEGYCDGKAKMSVEEAKNKGLI